MIVSNTTTLGMILDAARAKGGPPVMRISVHPGVADRICVENGPAALDTCGIPTEIDQRLSPFPGFRIHREPTR